MSYCRVLVDEWVRSGIVHAVIAPGSRSTPLAIAVAERLRTQVILDERSASYTALGLALATGRPTVVVCTSGTAATHFHGAVVEASQANVPLIVCTADRPPELQDVGAPQTIDQQRLYGSAVRWFASPNPPDPTQASTWRSIAARAACEAIGPRPGPVHLNLALREPLLEPDDAPDPPGRSDGGPWHRVPAAPPVRPTPPELAGLCARARRPLVVTGHLAPTTFILDGVPVLADHRGPVLGTVPQWDLLARSPSFIASHAPDLVVRAGLPPASKALRSWLATLTVPQLMIVPPGRWIDPDRTAAWMLESPVMMALTGEPGWADSWIDAGTTAASIIDTELGSRSEVTEPGVARSTFATRPAGSTLVVSSSMPVRDLESFAAPRSDVRVLANRGANGIDGVLSTAIGVALSGGPTTLLIGDLALFHDVGALTGLAERAIDLTLVVIDNNGGGIFSLLPQHDVLEPDEFETLFGTPQSVDIAALLGVHDISTRLTDTADGFQSALEWAATSAGVRAIVARTDREANLALHGALAAQVAGALT